MCTKQLSFAKPLNPAAARETAEIVGSRRASCMTESNIAESKGNAKHVFRQRVYNVYALIVYLIGIGGF